MSEPKKQCRYCGLPLRDDEKVCPRCHKKQESSATRITLYALVALMVLSVLGLLFFSPTLSHERTLDDTDTPGYEEFDDNYKRPELPKADGSLPSQSDLGMGQTFSADGADVTLNSASYWEGDEYFEPDKGKVYLLLNVTVTNTGDKDRNVLETSFTGYADGENVEEDFIGQDDLDYANLIPGTHETGNIVFQVPRNWSNFQLRVSNDFSSDQTATFTIDRSQVQAYHPDGDDFEDDYYDDMDDDHHNDDDDRNEAHDVYEDLLGI